MVLVKKGDRSVAVREIQGLLNSWFRAFRVKPDGDFGAKTEAAVMDFQREAGLLPDGIVGPKTYAALHGVSIGEPSGVDTLSVIEEGFTALKGLVGNALKSITTGNPIAQRSTNSPSVHSKKDDQQKLTRGRFQGYEGRSYIISSEAYKRFEGGAIQLGQPRVVLERGKPIPLGLKNECVHLVAYFGVPWTREWRRGPRVCDFLPGELPVGTVVATLRDNCYYSDYSGRSHVGIYLSHGCYERFLKSRDGSGVLMMDQYNGHEIAQRLRQYKTEADTETETRAKKPWTDSQGRRRERRVKWIRDGEEYYVLLTSK